MTIASLRRRSALALGLGLGIVAGRMGYSAAYLTRLMITGARQPLWRRPADVGLQSEDVVFPSDDGVKLRGWFIHRSDDDGTPAPTVIFVHGWPWNRLGNLAGGSILPDQTVDFLDPARALAQAGMHVLLFDLRNHGQSDAAPPVTFGVHEARDFVGAVAMLRARPDVDGKRIGTIGYSMGGNTIIYGIPRCQPIRAAIAVQPTSGSVFTPNLARTMFGAAGPLLSRLAGPLHQAFGAPALSQIAPARAASYLGETALLYIQGSGDKWGSVADVQAMVDATPNARPLVIAPSQERFGGYQYVNAHTDKIVGFFKEYLG